MPCVGNLGDISHQVIFNFIHLMFDAFSQTLPLNKSEMGLLYGTLDKENFISFHCQLFPPTLLKHYPPPLKHMTLVLPFPTTTTRIREGIIKSEFLAAGLSQEDFFSLI